MDAHWNARAEHQQKRICTMKTMAKLAIGALMAGGVAITAAAPADAGVSVGIGVGVPYYGPAPTCYDDWGRPYYCQYPAYYGGGPVFVGGWWGGGYWHGRYYERGYWDRGFGHQFRDRDDWRFH